MTLNLKSRVFEYLNELDSKNVKSTGPIMPMKVARRFIINLDEANELTKEWRSSARYLEKRT